jgi:uncharacterized protein (TIGR02452 family)
MHQGGKGRGDRLRKIAEATLEAISTGRYVLDGQGYDLSAKTTAAKQNVLYFPPNSSVLSAWKTAPPVLSVSSTAPVRPDIAFHEISTLDAAKLLSLSVRDPNAPSSARRIGVLNFASAKNPGGGFLKGAQAQEESIARSSNLYPTLMTEAGKQFYQTHKTNHDKLCFYTHAMIFSPGITVFRDDAGGWTTPLDIDIVTSAAVNAGVVRNLLKAEPNSDVEKRIEDVMRERMARVLYLFELQGVRDLVLGSFGTGVFRNNVATVASIWADLLAVDGARFRHSFDKVIFAILGEQTFKESSQSFEARQSQGAAL